MNMLISGLHGHPCQPGNTQTAAELLGKQRRKKKPWVAPEILNFRDQKRDLKKKRGEPEGAKAYG